ncbi:hypothetical protein EVG20_g6938, partial [Dentipellis fragilis]
NAGDQSDVHLQAQLSTVINDDPIQSIRFLTSFLNGCACGEALQAKKSEPGTNDTFIHLANLLTLDQSILAVTGNIAPDEAVVGIFTSSTSGREVIQKCTNAQGFNSTDLQPRPWESIDFEQPPMTIPSLKQHAQDLLSIFRYHKELELTADKLAHWIVFRCYPKIQQHLLVGFAKRSWSTDPVMVMMDWRPNNEDRKLFHEYVSDPKGQTNTTVTIISPMASTVESSGLSPDSSGTAFTFDIETARTWLGLISKSIITLRRLLNVVTDITAGQLNQTPDVKTLSRVDDMLRFTLALLRLPTLEWLFKCTSLARRFTTKRSPAFQDATAGSQDTDGDSKRAEDTFVDDDEQVPSNDENNGERVYRVIRTLVSWHTAVNYIVPRLNHLKNVNATLVTLLDHYKVQITDISNLKERIKATIEAVFDEGSGDKEHAEAAKKWFDDQAQRHSYFVGHVHAEAGIMALANYMRNPRVDVDVNDSLRNIFRYENSRRALPIGVSKKSCWACWQLGQKLFKKDKITVQLPGTHGTIFQWNPPAFGIPESVLKELADALKEEVVRRTVVQVGLQKSGSAQSSPQSIEDDPRNLPTRDTIRFIL